MLYLLARKASQMKAARTVQWVLVAIVAVDLIVVSRHYVKAVPVESYVGENDVVRVLKQNANHRRTLMFTQSSFYNFWLTYIWKGKG